MVQSKSRLFPLEMVDLSSSLFLNVDQAGAPSSKIQSESPNLPSPQLMGISSIAKRWRLELPGRDRPMVQWIPHKTLLISSHFSRIPRYDESHTKKPRISSPWQNPWVSHYFIHKHGTFRFMELLKKKLETQVRLGHQLHSCRCRGFPRRARV